MGLSVVSQIGANPGGGRILAIDYGRKRLGLAISDPLRLTARPLATWTRSNRRQDLARLRRLCREQEVRLIVLGWPLQLAGTQGEMAAEAARFAERVRAGLGIPVEMADERLTSWEAEQMLAGTGARGRKARGKQRRLDEVAAAVTLRDYLRSAGGAA